MGYDTKASDWEVAAYASLAGGDTAAGGWFFFYFRSKSADVCSGARFVGGGAGVGADLGKIAKAVKLMKNAANIEKMFSVLSYAASAPVSFGSIKTDTAFSLADLHQCPGRLTTASAAIIGGYTLMYITAATGLTTDYFASQDCSGWGWGFGAQVMTTAGVWFTRA